MLLLSTVSKCLNAMQLRTGGIALQKSRLSLGENSSSDLSKHGDKRQANGPSSGRDVLYSRTEEGSSYGQHPMVRQIAGRRDADAAITFPAVCTG